MESDGRKFKLWIFDGLGLFCAFFSAFLFLGGLAREYKKDTFASHSPLIAITSFLHTSQLIKLTLSFVFSTEIQEILFHLFTIRQYY